MKELLSKFLAQLHVIIFLYAAWSVYSLYDEHNTNLASIEEQFPSLQEEIEASEKKLSKIDEYRKNREEAELRVREVFSSIDSLQKQLPQEVNDLEVLDFLTKEARALNIMDFQINPLPEQKMGFYISKPYSIKGKGTFLQFLVFLERIDSAERLFNVKKLALLSGLELQKSRFRVIDVDLVIDTFKYNSAHTETLGIKEAEPAGAQPAPRPRSRRGRE